MYAIQADLQLRKRSYDSFIYIQRSFANARIARRHQLSPQKKTFWPWFEIDPKHPPQQKSPSRKELSRLVPLSAERLSKIGAEILAARCMAQPSDCFLFDLSNALAREIELLSNFFERQGMFAL